MGLIQIIPQQFDSYQKRLVGVKLLPVRLQIGSTLPIWIIARELHIAPRCALA